MDAREAVRLQYYRRWVRPDWERWLRPDWERYVHPSQHKAMRQEIAACTAAFETPRARAVRLRDEQAALEREQAWEAECAERKFRSDLAWARVKAAVVRDLEQRRLARKYSSDQPRVPAGSPDGGQWTCEDGNAQGADGVPQLVQDKTDRLLNDHIIQEHVAKTDEELKARIREQQFRGLFGSIGMDRNGSFDSMESARDFIGQTIANNPGDVAHVASGQSDAKFLIWRFGYQTGREAIMDTPDSEIRMRPTYEVGVVIVHDPSADFGYRVVTAFPRNFNPRTGR